ncbi:hypothetical protein [Thalassotalea piscium]|uniref:Uncharacterized protein n=1 Tax=Thalassotalea piscium TaxID=1230533 RepID=A0A7X0NIL9_9GAMM|nr:hypothetical protein [Thalassotalea piscium]MBB6544058.1 hypothetical protein [Thalassotalea piscium]
MKALKVAVLAFASIITLSSTAQTLNTNELSGKELLQEFNYNYPELANDDNFTKMVYHNKITGIKVFLSKNMPLLKFKTVVKGGDITPQFAVQCADNEDEVCTTTTKNGRVIKQSCECVAGGE